MVEQPLKEEAKPLEVSTPAEIEALRKEQADGEVLEFPSGLRVRLKRPQLASMIKEGIIPQTLLSTALDVSSGKEVKDTDGVQKAIEVMEIILYKAFVNPKLVKENPKDGEISVDDLSDDDRAFAFGYVQAGEAGLRRFRVEGQKGPRA